jgi:hypothetical protein
LFYLLKEIVKKHFLPIKKVVIKSSLRKANKYLKSGQSDENKIKFVFNHTSFKLKWSLMNYRGCRIGTAATQNHGAELPEVIFDISI